MEPLIGLIGKLLPMFVSHNNDLRSLCEAMVVKLDRDRPLRQIPMHDLAMIGRRMWWWDRRSLDRSVMTWREAVTTTYTEPSGQVTLHDPIAVKMAMADVISILKRYC